MQAYHLDREGKNKDKLKTVGEEIFLKQFKSVCVCNKVLRNKQKQKTDQTNTCMFILKNMIYEIQS